MQGAQVRPLVGKLTSHMLCNAAKKLPHRSEPHFPSYASSSQVDTEVLGKSCPPPQAERLTGPGLTGVDITAAGARRDPGMMVCPRSAPRCCQGTRGQGLQSRWGLWVGPVQTSRTPCPPVPGQAESTLQVLEFAHQVLSWALETQHTTGNWTSQNSSRDFFVFCFLINFAVQGLSCGIPDL